MKKRIRKAAIQLAVRRAFVHEARARAMSNGDEFRNSKFRQGPSCGGSMVPSPLFYSGSEKPTSMRDAFSAGIGQRSTSTEQPPDMKAYSLEGQPTALPKGTALGLDVAARLDALLSLARDDSAELKRQAARQDQAGAVIERLVNAVDELRRDMVNTARANTQVEQVREIRL